MRKAAPSDASHFNPYQAPQCDGQATQPRAPQCDGQPRAYLTCRLMYVVLLSGLPACVVSRWLVGEKSPLRLFADVGAPLCFTCLIFLHVVMLKTSPRSWRVVTACYTTLGGDSVAVISHTCDLWAGRRSDEGGFHVLRTTFGDGRHSSPVFLDGGCTTVFKA